MGASSRLFILLALLLGLQSRAENYPPTFRDVKLGSAPGESAFFITQLAADSVGNTFWAGGYSASQVSVGSLVLTNSGDYAACIFKLGPGLDERWAKGGGGGGSQGITGLAVDAQRDCYFAVTAWGNTLTFDNVTYTSPSNLFTVVFKYSRGGDRLWSHQANGIVADGWTRTLTVDSNSNVFFGGAFNDNVGGFEANRSFLRKLNSNGGTVWTRTADKIHTGFSYSLGTDITGNCFMLSSFTNATVTFGDTILQNRGAQSYVS